MTKQEEEKLERFRMFLNIARDKAKERYKKARDNEDDKERLKAIGRVKAIKDVIDYFSALKLIE